MMSDPSNHLLNSPDWPTSSTLNWHHGEYLFVLFGLHVNRSSRWQRFIASWFVPKLAFSIPHYDSSVLESATAIKIAEIVQHAGELIQQNVNQSTRISMSRILRLFWSICIPVMALLQIWVIFNPPHEDFIRFIPVWIAFNVVIYIPLLLTRRVKKRVNQSIKLCNESLALQYAIAPEQRDNLFMFLTYNSARQIAIVLAIKHQSIANLNISTYDSHTSTLVDVDDEDDELSHLSTTRMETDVCIPFFEEKLDYYFKCNINQWREKLAVPHSCLLTPFICFVIGLNRLGALIFPCSPHITHASSYPHALASELSQSSYQHLADHITRSMKMGVVMRLLAYSVPIFVITGLTLMLSGTLKMSFSSTSELIESFVILVFIFVPLGIEKLLRGHMQARIMSIIEYFNSEHSDQSLKLLYRYVGYHHLQLYFLIPLSNINQSANQSISQSQSEQQQSKKIDLNLDIDLSVDEWLNNSTANING